MQREPLCWPMKSHSEDLREVDVLRLAGARVRVSFAVDFWPPTLTRRVRASQLETASKAWLESGMCTLFACWRTETENFFAERVAKFGLSKVEEETVTLTLGECPALAWEWRAFFWTAMSQPALLGLLPLPPLRIEAWEVETKVSFGIPLDLAASAVPVNATSDTPSTASATNSLEKLLIRLSSE